MSSAVERGTTEPLVKVVDEDAYGRTFQAVRAFSIRGEVILAGTNSAYLPHSVTVEGTWWVEFGAVVAGKVHIVDSFIGGAMTNIFADHGKSLWLTCVTVKDSCAQGGGNISDSTLVQSWTIGNNAIAGSVITCSDVTGHEYIHQTTVVDSVIRGGNFSHCLVEESHIGGGVELAGSTLSCWSGRIDQQLSGIHVRDQSELQPVAVTRGGHTVWVARLESGMPAMFAGCESWDPTDCGESTGRRILDKDDPNSTAAELVRANKAALRWAKRWAPEAA